MQTNKIKILAPELVHKIAAGQVVERPASVVKELLDNSIDAGAKFIRVDLLQAGMKQIIVSDDGIGMNQDNLQKAYLPHSSSKISSETDLLAVESLGFRGEALASIAAVADLIIESRSFDEDLGSRLELRAKTKPKIEELYRPVGTRVIVKNLFAKLPARKKFLKSKAKELRKVMQTLTQFALAYPEIAFLVSHDEKILLETSSNQDLLERVALVLGEDIKKQLIPTSQKSEHLEFFALLAKPPLAFGNKQKQYLFVNQRPVVSSSLAAAIRAAYGRLLPPQKYPIFIAFLQLPASMLDVNVDPRKETVLFRNEKAVLDLAAQITTKALNKKVFSYEKFRKDYQEFLKLSDRGMSQYTAELLKDAADTWDIKDIKKHKISQIQKLYLVVETKNGFCIIDQHAAHERILYEEFKSLFRQERKKPKTFILKKPLVFELGFEEAQLLGEQLTKLQELGFDLEHFGNASFKLAAVPTLFKERDYIALIRELLVDLADNPSGEFIDHQTDKTLTFLACRSAIKAGDSLTLKERQRLLEKLAKTPNNYTCPHGRPIRIDFSLKDLQKLFKRS